MERGETYERRSKDCECGEQSYRGPMGEAMKANRAMHTAVLQTKSPLSGAAKKREWDSGHSKGFSKEEIAWRRSETVAAAQQTGSEVAMLREELEQCLAPVDASESHAGRSGVVAALAGQIGRAHV